MRYVFGDYILDTGHYELRRAGTPVALGPKPLCAIGPPARMVAGGATGCVLTPSDAPARHGVEL